MKYPLFLAAILPAYCQVTVQFAPEPMAVLQSVNVKNVGLWTVRACTTGPSVTLAEERFYMAAPPQIHLIGSDRARLVVMAGAKRSKKAIAAEWIGWGLMGATALTGFGPISATQSVVAALAMGSSIAGGVKSRLESGAPDLSPFIGQMLSGPVSIPTGGCVTRVAFAAKMKNPQPATVTIDVPAFFGQASPSPAYTLPPASWTERLPITVNTPAKGEMLYHAQDN